MTQKMTVNKRLGLFNRGRTEIWQVSEGLNNYRTVGDNRNNSVLVLTGGDDGDWARLTVVHTCMNTEVTGELKTKESVDQTRR